MNRRARTYHDRAGRGFTLVEVVFVVTIIIVLMALTAVTVGRSVRAARVASERQYILSLRIGVEHFKSTFGFLPPLVTGFSPTGGPAVAPASVPGGPILSGRSPFSLPIYLLGTMGAAYDGYDGLSQGTPREDGTWDTSAPANSAVFDLSRDPTRLRAAAGPGGKVINDRWVRPIYYYRWEPSIQPRFVNGLPNPLAGEVISDNIPPALFDLSEKTWAQNINTGQALRSGAFAIVSGGADGLIYDGPSTNPLWRALNADNIVEVGQ